MDGEFPPLEGFGGRQPGLSLWQFFQSAGTAGPPSGAEGFEDPFLVSYQPDEQRLECMPAVRSISGVAELPAWNWRLVAAPNVDVTMIAVENAAVATSGSGP